MPSIPRTPPECPTDLSREVIEEAGLVHGKLGEPGVLHGLNNRSSDGQGLTFGPERDQRGTE